VGAPVGFYPDDDDVGAEPINRMVGKSVTATRHEGRSREQRREQIKVGALETSPRR
jgi:hypothetical protein